MAKNKKTLDKEILNVLQNLEINDDEKTIKILMENLVKLPPPEGGGFLTN